jgi:hypothetical protein
MNTEDRPAHQVRAQVRRVRTVLNLGHVVDYCCRWAGPTLIAVGVLVICLKLISPTLTPLAAPVLWFIPAALVVALIFSRRGLFTEEQAAVWLDRTGRAGGSVIAANQGRSFLRSGPLNLPRAIFRPWRPVRALALPVAFLVAALLVPARRAHEVDPVKAIRSRSGQVRRRLHRAEELRVVSGEEVREIEAGLERAVEAARRSPESAAEAVDALQRVLEKDILKAARAARALTMAGPRMGRAGRAGDRKEYARQLRKALAAFEARLPDDLREKLQKFAKESGTQLDGLPGIPGKESLNEMLGKLSKEQLQELADELARQGLSGLGACGKCSELMNDAAARQALAELTEDGDGRPGRGGVNRGRADAELSFGKETDTSKMRLKPLALKNKEPALPGVRTGHQKVSAKEMPPEEFRPPSRTGTDPATKTGGSSSGGALGPRRLRAAAEYFKGDSP